MAFKEDRLHKVYMGSAMRNNGYRNIEYKYQPQIRLQGDWLKDLGFFPGAQMNIHCEEGKLTLTVLDEDKKTIKDALRQN